MNYRKIADKFLKYWIEILKKQHILLLDDQIFIRFSLGNIKIADENFKKS